MTMTKKRGGLWYITPADNLKRVDVGRLDGRQGFHDVGAGRTTTDTGLADFEDPENAIGEPRAAIYRPAPEHEPDRTGFPGAPEKGRAKIIREFNRRLTAGETLEGVNAEACALVEWYRQEHPSAPVPTAKSTENLIRTGHRSRKPIEA